MPPLREITESKQLLVEGRDAEVFFQALLRFMSLTGIQVQNFGGINELQGFLKALRNAPGFLQTVTALGIVRDAETDPGAAFQSACSALNSANLPVPTSPLELAGQQPCAGVLILPDATTPGMLETLLLETVADDPVMPCIEAYFECVEQQTGAPPNNRFKARVQAFLASRPRPGLLLGQAASAGYWRLESQALVHVKHFLQAL